MTVRISLIIIIVALFLLADSLVIGTSNPGASRIAELMPAAVQPPSLRLSGSTRTNNSTHSGFRTYGDNHLGRPYGSPSASEVNTWSPNPYQSLMS